MRLIDADKFIISLKDHIDKPMTAGLCATLVELAPTAYDIDKVVEELEEKCISPNDYPGYVVDLELAIEIVKVENQL